MKHYYYQIEVYNFKRNRWVKKRDLYHTIHELTLDHEHGGSRFGLFRPVKLKAIFENDECIYGGF